MSCAVHWHVVVDLQWPSFGHAPNSSVIHNFVYGASFLSLVELVALGSIKEYCGRNSIGDLYCTNHCYRLSGRPNEAEAILKGISLVEYCIFWQYGVYCGDTVRCVFECEMANDAYLLSNHQRDLHDHRYFIVCTGATLHCFIVCRTTSKSWRFVGVHFASSHVGDISCRFFELC